MALLTDPIRLAQWRRMTSQIYAGVRHNSNDNPLLAWQAFRLARDNLFKFHPQSPLDAAQRTAFYQLTYYDYEPALRVNGRIDTNIPKQTFRLHLPADGDFAYTRVAYVCFNLRGMEAKLSLFWIEGYGGGLFLPFKDATNGKETFGGGRYLYDTIKGADLGVGDDDILLDFNFAYNPSCAYNSVWVCPLPPIETKLVFAIEAGEKSFT